MLFCTTAAEWCITAWGATFVEDVAGASTDTAVGLMAGYFGGVLAGRTLGSRLARRYDPARLLAFALAVAAAGFAILWPSTAPALALVGLSLLGIGLGNLFPMGVSVAVALAPDRAVLASGRAVMMSAFAVVLAPLTVGRAPHGRDAGRRDVAEVRALGRAGHARAGGGGARTRASSATLTERRGGGD
jgi:fucose permease